MTSAKDLRVEPISSADANRVIQGLHYSGKVVRNSQLHLGVFLNGRCGGAMQFGPSLDKAKIQGLVRGTAWNGFLELNRLALADWLPRNSESRVLGYAMRLIRKNYPHIEWVISFADGTQCGDGTIYRASGFVLTGLKPSSNLVRLRDGSVIHKMTLESNPTSARQELGGRSYFEITGGKYDLGVYAATVGGTILPGFQFRYVYFVNPAARERLAVPIIPFDEIDRVGGRIYRGVRRAGSAEGGTSCHQQEGDGSIPIPAL